MKHLGGRIRDCWLPVVLLVLLVIILGLGGQIVTVTNARDLLEIRVAELEADRANLQAIAGERQAFLQQDERKLDAVRWCLTSSPTPIDCALWSLEAVK